MDKIEIYKKTKMSITRMNTKESKIGRLVLKFG